MCDIQLYRYRSGQTLHQISMPGKLPFPPKGATAYYNDKTGRRLAVSPCPLDWQLRAKGKRLAHPPQPLTWEGLAAK
jgi:hypothetical protein